MTMLVVLAIPVQGFAAATMLSCGPGHERMAGDAVGGHAHDTATAPHGHAHHVGVATHGPAAYGSVDVATPDRVPFTPPADVKCSACATCCTASAIPAAPLAVAVDRAASEAIPSRHQPSVDFVVERLEHPPRNLLA
ncbi:MAG TPA: hypothetical protein VK052_00425 [Zeimonas sp.]|nr:hypothetical protein [Zeimonas sp.]